jgi:hypothetical protein
MKAFDSMQTSQLPEPMNTTLNALIVEDSPEDALLLVRELQSAGFDPKWTRVETEPDYFAGLAERPDIFFPISLCRCSRPHARWPCSTRAKGTFRLSSCREPSGRKGPWNA